MQNMPITKAIYGRKPDDTSPEERMQEHLASLHPRRVLGRNLIGLEDEE